MEKEEHIQDSTKLLAKWGELLQSRGRAEDALLFLAYLLSAGIKNNLVYVFEVLIVDPGRQSVGQLTNWPRHTKTLGLKIYRGRSSINLIL